MKPSCRNKILPLLCSFGVLLAVNFNHSADAQTNWPSFRGVNACGTDLTSETPTTWDTEKSKNIAWKKEIPGLGHSSPVIWGDKLFVTTAVNPKSPAVLKVGLYGDPSSSDDTGVQQWKVLCLNKKSGDILWQSTAREGTPKSKRHPKATHANCTVATDGANVVAFFGSEGIYCYDMDGHERWKKDLGTLMAAPVVYNDTIDKSIAAEAWEWGFASSPVIYGKSIFIQCDGGTNGFVAALDIDSGREIWRTLRDDTATWSTPCVSMEGTHPQVILNGWRHMGGYDLNSGKEIWRMSGGGDCPVPTPVLWNDLVFIMSAHGPRKPIYAVRLDAVGDVSLKGGAATNKYVCWSSLKGASYMQTPLVYEDHLYSCHVDGILSCFDARTGALIYKERLGTGGDGYTASPVASKGKLYFTSEQGAVFVVKPGTNFDVMATNQMGDVCMATPAISEGKLYFRTQSRIVAVGSGM